MIFCHRGQNTFKKEQKMKKFSAFLLTGLLSVSMLSANETITKQGVGGLQSQEVEFLFGANAKASDFNVAVLSEEELKGTRGGFVDPATAVAVGGLIYTVGENNGWWNGLKKIKLKFW